MNNELLPDQHKVIIWSNDGLLSTDLHKETNDSYMI